MRTLSAHGFIALPHLDAEETSALIHKLVAQGAATHVPASAVETFDAMKHAGAALDAALPTTRAPAGGTAVRDTHVAVQRAWALCAQWLGALSGLDDADDPRVQRAKRLNATLFGDGLGFANARVEVEWTRSELKIKAITNAHLAREFDALGGRVFWDKITAAHAAEGAAAHLTTATPADAPASAVQTTMLAAQDAIREYVAHVVGTVRRSRPATQTTADALLRPLATWTPDAATAATPTAPPPATPATTPGSTG